MHCSFVSYFRAHPVRCCLSAGVHYHAGSEIARNVCSIMMNQPCTLCLSAADAILLIHFAFVGFVVFGLALIWMGYFAKWNFVRNAAFRVTHLFAIGFVLCETIFGMICPLTEWENQLRIKGGQGQVYEFGFISQWIHNIIFYDFSDQTFMVVYTLFFALVLLTFRKIPPDVAWRKKFRK